MILVYVNGIMRKNNAKPWKISQNLMLAKSKNLLDDTQPSTARADDTTQRLRSVIGSERPGKVTMMVGSAGPHSAVDAATGQLCYLCFLQRPDEISDSS